MGIKRRIMTSGQKFVDKHRALLKKMMDASKFGGVTGDPAAIDIPDQKPFIDNLKVFGIENQTFSFIAALGGVPKADDTITVTLNGTVLSHKPDLPNSIESSIQSIGGVAYTKAYYGRPNFNAPTGTEWANSDRRCCAADEDTPAVASVGENTLKVVVTSNNKVRASQTVKFTAAAATAAISEHDNLVTADDGNNQLDTNLTDRVTGIVAGDKNAWALDTNKYEIEVTKEGTAVALAAKGGEGRTVKANAAGVADAVAVVSDTTTDANGSLTQTDLLAAPATGNYIVTFHLLNMKGQRQHSFTAAVQAVA